MFGYVNGIDWVNAESMRYWSFPASYSEEKKKSEARNMIFSGETMAALKVDGYYERLIKDEDGNYFMVARSKNVKGEAVNKIEWVPQLHPFMESLPNGTVLLSECYIPGKEGSKNITSLLGCLKEKCIARQEKDKKLHFYIFDIMAQDGINYHKTQAAERFNALKNFEEKYKSEYVEYAHYLEGEELWNKLQEYLADGREGIVLMRKDAPVYFKRTPAHVSLKIKKELRESIDCYLTGRAAAPKKEYAGKEIETWRYWINEITGERLPEGEHWIETFKDNKPYSPVTKSWYKGFAGSLEIAVLRDGKEYSLGYISGLSDEVKQNYKNYMHRVVEVAAMQLTDSEPVRLRHGKIISFRPIEDKKWDECDFSQIEKL